MKHASKKPRSRSKQSKRSNKSIVATVDVSKNAVDEHKTKALSALMEAFSLISMEEAVSAYDEANGDMSKAAEIIGEFLETSEDTSVSSGSGSSMIGNSSTMDYASTSSSSMTGISVGSWMGSISSLEGLMDVNMEIGKGFSRGNKGNKVVASTGTVSSVLGKEYMNGSPKRESVKSKDFSNGRKDIEEAEQFLYAMLGDECELSMEVVRDVFCNCGYGIEKALDTLLDLSASSHEMSWTNPRSDFADRAQDSTLHSYNSDGCNVQYMGFPIRSYSNAVTNSETHLPSHLPSGPGPGPGRTKSNLSQTVLESLFNMSDIGGREPSTVNWRKVVKKMKSLGQGFDYGPDEQQQKTYALVDKGNEYQMFRESANQHWNSMTSFYQRAATAYSRGQRGHAAYLSDQGKLQTKRAREAEDKASREIFQSRNKSIENVITIDMHGQHVKQAMQLLKLHLLFGTYVSSIQTIRVITGNGSHGLGKSKVKQAVIKLVEREGIKWTEENQGTVLINLEGKREFSFLDTDSDDAE